MLLGREKTFLIEFIYISLLKEIEKSFRKNKNTKKN